ncbi:YeeE/YedE family protein [Phreatobacter stygius]|uniref:YeeE/YedE family protein n=1 Tax=Phreatobacter stygius TaxID=1940610 RepID=A0A4D7AVP1_9HYPH|nr:YeeE/YedE family protein [Phreatobacter stygius]QCI65774.1 YeeE/YedE family protein [Phreatobacter stygius]
MTGYWPSLVGGMLIGLSVAMLMLLNGRIAGISGIVASLFRPLFRPLDQRLAASAAFIIGLLLGPLLYRAGFGQWPAVHIQVSLPLIAVAGLLVGFGTRLGSGCTSGHGVAGLARLSPRSVVAVVTFLGTAVLTVLIMRGLGT